MPKVLASVRSNLTFSVHYESAELIPKIEMVFLCWKPVYNCNEEGEITKENSIEEIRFDLGPKALNQLIADLKMQAVNLQNFEQAGEALNSVIRTMKNGNKES